MENKIEFLLQSVKKLAEVVSDLERRQANIEEEVKDLRDLIE